RPLLEGKERGKRIKELWEEREKKYLAAADQVVEVKNMSAEEIADLIIRNYRKLVKEVEP
ncbi:shikimate kinase, partial [Candidatus Hakubella thermalkaliphila]